MALSRALCKLQNIYVFCSFFNHAFLNTFFKFNKIKINETARKHCFLGLSMSCNFGFKTETIESIIFSMERQYFLPSKSTSSSIFQFFFEVFDEIFVEVPQNDLRQLFRRIMTLSSRTKQVFFDIILLLTIFIGNFDIAGIL